MGLDMYIYKRKKPNLDETAIYDEEILEKYDYCLENEYDEKDDNCGKKVGVIIPLIDIKSLAKDYEFKEDFGNDVIIRKFNKEKYELIDRPNFASETIIKTFTIEEFEEKYLYRSLEYFYIWEEKEIAYWRKDYNLQNYIHDMFNNEIENCGYQKLNEEELIKILSFNEKDKKILEEIDFTEECEYFYLEWY